MENNNIIETIKENGGMTLGLNASKGYMVSLYGYEFTTKNEDEVLKKINEYKKIIENKAGCYVGVWLEDGLYYIDVSILIDNFNEALEVGKKNKQLAIYDLKNNNSIYIKNYRFIKYYTLYNVIYNNNNEIMDYKIVKQYDIIDKISRELKIKKQNIKNALYNETLGKVQVLDEKYRITKDFMLVDEL